MSTLLQIDSIEDNVPRQAQAVAGYTGGLWPTYHIFYRDFPNLVKLGRVLSIAPQAYMKARCLDVEPHDAGNYQAPTWYKAHADHSEGLPWLYTSAGNGAALLAVMARAGYHQGHHFYYWSAHYGAGRHICGLDTCGYPRADGTQFDDVYEGQNLDASMIQSYCYPHNAPKFPISRFRDWPVPVPIQWHNRQAFPLLSRTTHIHERQIVANYLRLKKQKNPNPHWMFATEQQLLFLRKCVWIWAHQYKDKHGKPSWGVNWRGWRYMELFHWTEHVKQAW